MPSPTYNSQWWQRVILVAVCFYGANVSASSNNSSLADIWPDMANLPTEPQKPGLSYGGGGLSLNICCKLALNESVTMQDGRLSFVPGQTFLHGDVRVFERYGNPCQGPAYTGYEASVQQGTITYSWCAQRCPGWQRIELDETNAWVQQMLAYTLPAAIFSTNIARRHQIRIPRQYFPRLTLSSVLSLAYKLPIATVLAVVDVVMWLIVVFCLSGPMILSGLYECLLDHKVIRQLAAKTSQSKLTFKQRCHLAMILPLGNLDQELAWDASVSLVKGLPDNEASATEDDRHISKKIRLLLQTQQGFGTVLGIGVLFFISSFIYACLELQDKLGGSVFSHNLAFGIFWMVIPHVAIVANTALTTSDLTAWDLLTIKHIPKSHQGNRNISPSNNTSSNKARIWQRVQRHLGMRARDTTASPYRTAWQWDQGCCKMRWLERYLEEYPGLPLDLRKYLGISCLELAVYVWLPAVVMLVVPCALGSLISITTPMVGIACKGIIPIVYLGAQSALMVLWQLGVTPTAPFSRGRAWLRKVLRGLCTFFAFAAGFFSIGATIIVDIGLTNNCLCLIPMSQWMNRFDPSVTTFLGSNVDEGKYYASRYWLNCGAAAAAFLFAMMYFGWWWSRYLWTRFFTVCDEIGGLAPPTAPTVQFTAKKP